ncbi:unnamed protein product [Nippostrongylus brasiliensis]|uniref:TIL domain-containing protein n=1 Tax=Nippostrongylus brasiliensis TaxID=27835 RepID=A0A0N4XE88_NIPBR|nr:hypothetical protein Q1695_014654 [Nippostrongylus brasiliensis]VDL63897.1 unnamed protein product [Nippostrongylus brasiliensis]
MKMQTIVVVVLCAVIARAYDTPKCDPNGQCGLGFECYKGDCIRPRHCPQLYPVDPEPGCAVEMVVDEFNCPMPKEICGN